MAYSEQELDQLFALIRDSSSLPDARGFLEQHELKYSASTWTEVIEHRFKPAIQEDRLQEPELIDFLRLHEEFGGQHVFLYRCPRRLVKKLTASDRVQKELRRQDLEPILKQPLVDYFPRYPGIVDVRWENRAGRVFVVKLIEKREYRKYGKEREEDGQLIRSFETLEVRAVNLFRLHDDGLLELRIQSHPYWNYSEIYTGQIRRMWAAADGLFDRGEFNSVELRPVKEELWRQRAALEGKTRFVRLHAINGSAASLIAAAGRVGADLARDPGVVESMVAFLQEDGYLDECYVWWLKREAQAAPSEDILVGLAGEINEFSVDRRCSQASYEFVLDRLRDFLG